MQVTLELGDGRAGADEFLATLRGLAALGVDSIQGKLPGVWEIERIQRFGREIIPAAAEL